MSVHRPPLRSAAIALFVAAILLSGCGKKGPLYLPKDAPKDGAAATPAAPGEPQQKDKTRR